jgi:hypothetical protein
MLQALEFVLCVLGAVESVLVGGSEKRVACAMDAESDTLSSAGGCALHEGKS